MRVPFPHLERAVVTVRPALVLAERPTGIDSPVLWTAMITNALRPDWPGDVLVPDPEALGLIIPSKIRTAKLTTVVASAASSLGRVDAATWDEVRGTIHSALAHLMDG